MPRQKNALTIIEAYEQSLQCLFLSIMDKDDDGGGGWGSDCELIRLVKWCRLDDFQTSNFQNHFRDRFDCYWNKSIEIHLKKLPQFV